MKLQDKKSRRVFWAAALALAGLSVPLACLWGAKDYSAYAVLQALGAKLGLHASGDVAPELLLIVGDLRLPRVLLAFGTGSALGIAGVVFQGILRNPLADPFTLGVSSGAAFGASLAISLGLSGLPLWGGAPLIALAAFAGAALALGAVMFLGGAGLGLKREVLILAGVVVSAFLAALISLVKALDEASVAGIVFWIMGSFQGRGWLDLRLFAPGALLGLAPLLLFARDLDVLAMGDVEARQLGLDAGRARLWLLLGASLLTASCVAVAGIIGFVGLIVPHLVRLLLGERHVPLLVASAICSGVLLLCSDLLARSILPGGVELPVGVITALLGGPFFCLLLKQRAKTLGGAL